GLLSTNTLAVDLLLATVSAGIGLHLELTHLFAAGVRALSVGGIAAGFIAALNLVLIRIAAQGQIAWAFMIGTSAILATFALYRPSTRAAVERRRLLARFELGAPLSLTESASILDALEDHGPLEESTLRRLILQLHPSIGELIPVRESPMPHGEGCRWLTYWEGKSGWALAALCREPGSPTPLHAHPP